MTTIESIDKRKALNIDTFERAILYSAILLRKANISNFPSNHPYYNAVSIAFSKATRTAGAVNIKAKFPYNNQFALFKGENFLESIETFSEINPGSLSITPQLYKSNLYVLPQEPSDINSLEKYLLWLCYLFTTSLHSSNINLDPVNFAFTEGNPTIASDGTVTSTNSFLDVSVVLEYNPILYAEYKNLLAALVSKPLTGANFVAAIQAVSSQNVSVGTQSVADVIFLVIDYVSSTHINNAGRSNSGVDENFIPEFVNQFGSGKLDLKVSSIFDIDPTPVDPENISDSSTIRVNILGGSVAEPPPSDIDSAGSGRLIVSGSSS